MKLSSARSAKAGKRWHEVSVVSWKRPKATGDRNVLRNHILNFDIVTLCKLIFYNVYVRTLNQKNVFFSMCGLLVLGKESFIPKKLDLVGVKRLFRAQCRAVLQKKKKKKRWALCQSAVFPVCFTSPVLPSVHRDKTRLFQIMSFSHYFRLSLNLSIKQRTSGCDVNTRGLFSSTSSSLFCYFQLTLSFLGFFLFVFFVQICWLQQGKMNVLHNFPKNMVTRKNKLKVWW